MFKVFFTADFFIENEKSKGIIFLMDYINNIKYFLPQKPFWKIVGGVIAALGAIIMVLPGRGSMMLGCIPLFIGACIFIFAKDARPSDADIDNAVEKKIKALDELARRGVDIRERLIKAFPPVSFSGYNYRGSENDPDLKVQRGSDKKYRSNKYSAAEILFAMEKLHIFMYQFCITKEEEDQRYFEAKYTDLKNATLEHGTNVFTVPKGKSFDEVTLEYQSIVIRDNDDNVIFDMPVTDGADVDKTIEIINRLITSKKEELAANE